MLSALHACEEFLSKRSKRYSLKCVGELSVMMQVIKDAISKAEGDRPE
jgi:hypothetical protein